MNHGKGKEDINYSIPTLFLPVSVPRKNKQQKHNRLNSDLVQCHRCYSMNEFGIVSI